MRCQREFAKLAPQSGYVSNSCGSVDPLIEPADVYCFQSDPSAPPTLVHGGHPAWTRLELVGVGPFGSHKGSFLRHEQYRSTWARSGGLKTKIRVLFAA